MKNQIKELIQKANSGKDSPAYSNSSSVEEELAQLVRALGGEYNA